MFLPLLDIWKPRRSPAARTGLLWAAGAGITGILLLVALAWVYRPRPVSLAPAREAHVQSQVYQQQADQAASNAEARKPALQRSQSRVEQARRLVLATDLTPPMLRELPGPVQAHLEALREENRALRERVTLLEAQDTDRTAEIQALRAALDKERLAYTLAKQAAEARMEAVKAARWKGRIEGLATGLTLGYLRARQ